MEVEGLANEFRFQDSSTGFIRRVSKGGADALLQSEGRRAKYCVPLPIEYGHA